MARRQAVGLILLFLILLAGRAVRRTVLLGPDGAWRDPLWLDGLLPPVEVVAAEAPPPPSGPFHVNSTTVDTLCYLKGVGPKLAARIVAERAAGGPFVDAEDLKRVKGIGPALSTRLAPHLVFATADSTQDSAPPAEDHDEGLGRARPDTMRLQRDEPP